MCARRQNAKQQAGDERDGEGKRQHRGIDRDRGCARQIGRQQPQTHHATTTLKVTTPIPPPMIDNSTDSAINWRTIWTGLPPSPIRTAISERRREARASSKPATLAQATNSMRTTAANSIRRLSVSCQLTHRAEAPRWPLLNGCCSWDIASRDYARSRSGQLGLIDGHARLEPAYQAQHVRAALLGAGIIAGGVVGIVGKRVQSCGTGV